ncbi:hypothetical protein Bhyg_07085, partial [Pseudolycoriella hygida]
HFRTEKQCYNSATIMLVLALNETSQPMVVSAYPVCEAQSYFTDLQKLVSTIPGAGNIIVPTPAG